MIRIIIVALAILLLTSCATDSEMREDFSGSTPRVLMDPITNKYYTVEHNFFDNYWVEPLAGTDLYKLIIGTTKKNTNR